MKQTRHVLGSYISVAAIVACAFGFSVGDAQGRSVTSWREASDPRPTEPKPPQRRRSTKKSTARVKPAVVRAPAKPRWSTPAGAPALASAVGTSLASHTRNGAWGAIIVSLTRGDTLFAQNADAMMQPASTMKMYTSA